jgi:heme/copper-type cytochrome/quinol oxidase subunit 2
VSEETTLQQDELQEQNKPKNKSEVAIKTTFWTAMAILVLLFLLSLVVLSIQLYGYATLEKRALALHSNMDAQLDLFSVQYENASGEIVVQGADGQKVVAPGTKVEYTIRLRNADKVALNYDLVPKATFSSEHEIPILVRVIAPDGTYIAGDAKTWLPVSELNDKQGTGLLLRGEACEYVFQWKWPFESGDDAYDTFLGNLATEEDVRITISFTAYAEANTSPDHNGGWFGCPYGHTFYTLIFLILLAAAIIIMLIYKALKKRRDRQQAQELAAEGEDAPVDAPSDASTDSESGV